jgi:hypothetical protein
VPRFAKGKNLRQRQQSEKGIVGIVAIIVVVLTIIGFAIIGHR